jgi:hypothetical protein
MGGQAWQPPQHPHPLVTKKQPGNGGGRGKSLTSVPKRWSRRADLNRGPADYESHKYLNNNGNLDI